VFILATVPCLVVKVRASLGISPGTVGFVPLPLNQRIIGFPESIMRGIPEYVWAHTSVQWRQLALDLRTSIDPGTSECTGFRIP
jgi:hypothetical protein